MCHHKGDRARASNRASDSEDEAGERESWWGVHGADRLRAMVAGRKQGGDAEGSAEATPEYPAVELAARRREADESADGREREEPPAPTDD